MSDTPNASGPTAQLARFAASLTLDAVPDDVVQRARDCLLDSVAIALKGGDMPWSRIVVDYVRGEKSSGNSHVFGHDDMSVSASLAGLANGVLCHAMELDSLRKPGAGVHPGAIVVPAALAAAQEVGASGRELLQAIIAGVEVVMRVGASTHHSAEPRGFHAPGLTGPFGAAAAAGRIYGLDGERMNAAFGIAASTAGGLMQFSAEGAGAMVKRLHIGRAAQSGIQAARLAALGLDGPRQALEGKKGFLNAYCAEQDLNAITDGLGTRFETLLLCFKRYPCHITAHTAVFAIESLRKDAGLAADSIERIVVEGTDRMATANGNQFPTDPAMANYSIPFCVAAALTAAPDDPDTFEPARLDDPAVRGLLGRIEVVSDGRHSHSDWKTKTIVTLRDGTAIERVVAEFPGTPAMPLTAEDLKRRFEVMTGRQDPARMRDLFERLVDIDNQKSVGWIF